MALTTYTFKTSTNFSVQTLMKQREIDEATDLNRGQTRKKFMISQFDDE